MSTIITKNSSTASAVPLAGDLVKGELAVNVTDKKLYTKDNSANIVKVVGSLGNQEANAVAITGGAVANVTIAMGANRITGMGDPTSNQDAATKKYVDDRDALELSLTGGTMSGAIAMGTNKITDLGTPTANADAATKLYVDTADALKLSLAGGVMSGVIAMGNNKITGLGTPTADADATTKVYVDGILGSATAAAASAASAAASLDSFDDRYLGTKTTDPTVDNDGNALLTGALYWNSVGSVMKVYTGLAWVAFNPVNNPVDQSDIGTAPNEIPLNQYLGSAAYVDINNFVTPESVQTITGTKTFAGTSSTMAMVLNDAAEVATVSATAATGTINYDITTQSVLFYTSNASANWTVNFRASSGTSLNTALATGQSVTVAFLVTQGATAFYNTTVQVDGTATGVTTRWLGGAPTAGNASGIDSYRYLIIKTGSATYTVLASVTQFKA